MADSRLPPGMLYQNVDVGGRLRCQCDCRSEWSLVYFINRHIIWFYDQLDQLFDQFPVHYTLITFLNTYFCVNHGQKRIE
ncbi:hypothetical protein N7522_002351 [Penicillium canescens]|nr:hypothetical protein N7522_002351 [Penicillium canescens]